MRFWFRSNLRFKNLRHTSSWQRFKVCGDLNGLNGLTGLLLCCWNYNISLALTACNNFCLKQQRLTNSAPNLRQMGRFAPLILFFLRNQFGAHFVLGDFFDFLPCWLLCHRECMVALNALGRRPRLLDVGTWSLQIIPTPRLSMTVFANTP